METKMERLLREIEQLDQTYSSWMAQGRAAKAAAHEIIAMESIAAKLDLSHDEVLDLEDDAGKPFYQQAEMLRNRRKDLVDQVKAEVKRRATVRVTDTQATA